MFSSSTKAWFEFPFSATMKMDTSSRALTVADHWRANLWMKHGKFLLKFISKIHRGQTLPCTEVISNTTYRVLPHFQTPRRQLKILAYSAVIFLKSFEMFVMWWKTVPRIWYIFSIKTKTKEKTEKYNAENPHSVATWRIINDFEKAL